MKKKVKNEVKKRLIKVRKEVNKKTRQRNNKNSINVKIEHRTNSNVSKALIAYS